ncbi:hypothetical protein NDU88_001306 [Pleurodeles waltl]|uniref:Uncharacterized protein n=1 Tax=Pleurodeles waltl TaxID=8319 RepID=A0AAV7SYZ1_PLEWA|nr:hypothetical protein NDU88_001306 [Pleurodeles waltl]
MDLRLRGPTHFSSSSPGAPLLASGPRGGGAASISRSGSGGVSMKARGRRAGRAVALSAARLPALMWR